MRMTLITPQADDTPEQIAALLATLFPESDTGTESKEGGE